MSVSLSWCRLPGPQLKWPYALIAETETLLSAKARMFNIYLISTAGVAPEDINRCLQCAPRALSQLLALVCWCTLNAILAANILCAQRRERRMEQLCGM